MKYLLSMFIFNLINISGAIFFIDAVCLGCIGINSLFAVVGASGFYLHLDFNQYFVYNRRRDDNLQGIISSISIVLLDNQFPLSSTPFNIHVVCFHGVYYHCNYSVHNRYMDEDYC